MRDAGSGVALSPLAAAWPGGGHGPSITVAGAEHGESRATSAARQRCELAFRLKLPGSAVIAQVECSYEHSRREQRVRELGPTELNPPADHGRWVWVALALLPVLLVYVLLSEAEH